jgi:hypothetical protein
VGAEAWANGGKKGICWEPVEEGVGGRVGDGNGILKNRQSFVLEDIIKKVFGFKDDVKNFVGKNSMFVMNMIIK